MDPSGLFRIVSDTDRVIHVEILGFWSDEMLDESSDRYFELFTKAVDRQNGQPFLVLADLSNTPFITEHGIEFMVRAMKYAHGHGLYKSVQVLPRAMTRMGVSQAAAKVDDPGFRTVVPSLSKGFTLINELKRELPSGP